LRLIANNFYRIFSQSHIYSLFLLIITLTLLALIGKKYLGRKRMPLIIIFILTSLSVLISYSRSFWLSFAVVFLVMIYYFIKRYNFSVSKVFRYLALLALVLIVEVAFIFTFVNIPNWLRPGGTTTSLASLVEDRLGDTDEAALQSRWNLLEPLAQKMVDHPVLGSGFGTEVTYVSEDPRQVEQNGGLNTTFVFEWGYFDIILKIGLLGLVVYLLFIWRIAQLGLKVFKQLDYDRAVLVLGLLFGLLVSL